MAVLSPLPSAPEWLCMGQSAVLCPVSAALAAHLNLAFPLGSCGWLVENGAHGDKRCIRGRALWCALLTQLLGLV